MILSEYLRYLGRTYSGDVNDFHVFFQRRDRRMPRSSSAALLTCAGVWGPVLFLAASFPLLGRVSFYPALGAGLSFLLAGMALFFLFVKRYSFVFWQREVCGALCFLGQVFIVLAAFGQEDSAVFGAFFLFLGALCLSFPLLVRGGGYPVFSAALGLGLWALGFRALGDPYAGMPCFITISLPFLLAATLSPPPGKHLHRILCVCLMLPLFILLILPAVLSAAALGPIPVPAGGTAEIWEEMLLLPPIFYAVSALFVLRYQEFSFAPFMRASRPLQILTGALIFASAFFLPLWAQGALFGLFLAYLLGSVGLFLTAAALLSTGFLFLLWSGSDDIMMFYGLGACIYLGGEAFFLLHERRRRRS